MDLYTVIIELTRRCNMRCDHCLRGDTQDMNISDEILDNFFRKIKGSHITYIALTGGEVSLVPDRIEAVIKYAKKYHVDMGSFYIVTNAKIVPDKFLIAVIKLHAYCSDNKMSGLKYSTDHYHEELNASNIQKLQVFSFTNPKGDLSQDAILSEGRGENINWRPLDISPYKFENGWIDGDVYLNCKGNIVPSCDLSYESQDIPSLILGNVMEDDFNIEACCKKWNDTCENKSVTTFEMQELSLA